MRTPLLAGSLLLLALSLGAGVAHAEIYRWTDASGTDHFVMDINQVPPQYRQQALQGAAKRPALQVTGDGSKAKAKRAWRHRRGNEKPLGRMQMPKSPYGVQHNQAFRAGMQEDQARKKANRVDKSDESKSRYRVNTYNRNGRKVKSEYVDKKEAQWVAEQELRRARMAREAAEREARQRGETVQRYNPNRR